MKKYLFAIFLLMTSFFFLNSISLKSQENETKPDSAVSNNLVEDSLNQIVFLEDFSRFKNHSEVEEFFGKENVSAKETEFGAGYQALVTIIYPKNKNQIMLVWKQGTGEYKDLEYVTQYTITWDIFLTKGGKQYPMKSNLKLGMTLENLVELNGAPIKFNDFAFSLSRQNIVGLVIASSLTKGLKKYDLKLKYDLPKDNTKQPDDLLYLNNEKIASSTDPKVNQTKVIVSSINYYPFR